MTRGWALGSARVEVVPGDLTEAELDAIVLPISTGLTPVGPGTAALARRTQGRLQAALRAGAPGPRITAGEVVVTEGMGLPCRHVLHVATHASAFEEAAAAEVGRPVEMDRLAAVARGVAACIREAERLGATSLGLPLLGTEGVRVPPGLSLEVMLNALAEALPVTRALKRVAIFLLPGEPLSEARGLLARRAAEQPPTADITEPATTTGRVEPEAEASPQGPDRTQAGVPTQARTGDDEALRRQLRLLEAENHALRAQMAELEAQLEPTPTAELAMPAAFAVSTVAAEQEPTLQAQNLCTALQILLRYLGALSLADYEEAGAWDSGTNEELRSLVANPTGEGRWHSVALAVDRAFTRRRGGSFFAEVPGAWVRERGSREHWSPMAGALKRLIDTRNAYTHGMGTATEGAAISFLDEALPEWRTALAEAAPLLRYRLFSLDRVVDVAPDGGGQLVYQVRWLTGESFVPRSERVTWAQLLPKGRLYLTDGAAKRFLPLHPFLEYRLCGETRSVEVWSLDAFTRDEVTHSTFRFAYSERRKVTLPGWLQEA